PPLHTIIPASGMGIESGITRLATAMDGQSMSRIMDKLSARKVKTAKPKKGNRTAVLSDGGNLYLQVSLGPDGNVRRSWTFRYGRDGARHEMGLGSANTFSLKEARERAKALRKQLADHIDPLATREADRRAKLAEVAK